MKTKIGKRAVVLYEIIIHIILIALIFGLFFGATTYRANSKAVRQQIIEKQTALMIDSAPSGTNIILYKENLNGRITKAELSEGKIFAYVDDNMITKGYSYFSKYEVSLDKKEDKYIINIK